MDQVTGDGVHLRRRKPFRLALGVERFGLVALRVPVLASIAVIVLAFLAGLGVARIKTDDSLSQLFRSDTSEYKLYEEVTRRFPSSEFDVLVVVEGSSLLDRGSIERLRDLVTELQLIDGTRGIISLFSARQPPIGGRLPEALFPAELPRGSAYDALISQVKANEIIRGKLLSEDGQLALIVLALDPAAVAARLAPLIGDIRKTVEEDIAGTGLTGELSGVPVMQLDIRNAMERDRVIYNALGFAAGCLIAIVFFRRVAFMLIAAGPPLTAILLALGALGWLDFRLNIFLNVMTPLIMVISFSDSMQLTFIARDRLIAGHNKYEAFRAAILIAGPACVLTHATAGLSFVSLLFANSELIRTFGEAGIVATVVALATVLTLVPLFGVMLVHREARFVAKVRGADAAVDMLRRFCGHIAERMVSRPGLYTLISASAIAALGFVYANLEPRYRLADLVPDKERAVAASGALDAKLTGANPLDILIELPQGEPLYSPAALETVGEVHAILERQAGVGNVWSLESLRRWLTERAGKADVATLKQYVDILPPYLVRRFVSPNEDAVVVSGRIPDKDANELLPVIQSLDRSLEAVRAQHPGTVIAVTGLSAVAARNSAAMIGKLNYGLTVEIVFVAAFVGLAFRSGAVMGAIILPGIFPVLMSGDMLWLLGDGLQFASIVALTVSFGLALSATIHFLNRLRLEERPGDGAGLAVKRATVLVGPALILTSIVLACGLIATVLSDLPSLRLFGWLSAFAMISALIADMLILRPAIMFLRNLAARAGRPAG